MPGKNLSQRRFSSCISHRTRLQNVLCAPGINMIENSVGAKGCQYDFGTGGLFREAGEALG
jgi:hypothetical protein